MSTAALLPAGSAAVRFAQPTPLAAADLAAMQAAVRAIETIASLPGYRALTVDVAPSIARPDPGLLGAFMGYDFHLGSDGPRLIEINVNAGGAFLLARHLRQLGREAEAAQFDQAVVAMVLAEWGRLRLPARPQRVAIIDETPEAQFLRDEFFLARDLLLAHGIEAVVADAAGLEYRDGQLLAGGQPVDMVYNRLCDFMLDRPEHAALAQAYAGQAVVVTPNPHLHALLADKRNLAILCDRDGLIACGASASLADQVSRMVPKTVLVTPANADALWRGRKGLFFKPLRGYGSKAAYRGDKLTTGTWQEILQGAYVAQDFVAPSECLVTGADGPTRLKADFRLYTYGGQTLLVAARPYQGQTTNLRTPGGGLSPVYIRRD